MKIRPYNQSDYIGVIDLLTNAGVEPPKEPSDIDGLGIVAEAEGKIVGFIWALVGQSTHAYIDYWATDKKYPILGLELLKVIEAILKTLNIKRYTFYVEPDNKKMLKAAENIARNDKLTAFRFAGMKKLRDLKWFRKEML